MPTSKKSQRKKPKTHRSPAKLKTPKDPNSVERLVLGQLAGKANRAGIDIARSLKSATLDRSLEGASTITLEVADPDYVLTNSGIFDAQKNGRIDPLEIKVDGLPFRLVKVNPRWGAQGNVVSLTFEDRNVNLLRGKVGKARVLRRDQGTRAQFIEKLVDEVEKYPIPFVSPEKKIKQDIARPVNPS